MFDENLPDVVMNYFYKVYNGTNTVNYIATEHAFLVKQLYCNKNTNFVGVSYNRYKKSWSVYKNKYTLNQELHKHTFRAITKTEFIYEYNKALVVLSNIKFE